ncbi:ABC transporter permease [Paenibacillus arenilitoris]|nr:ABC transporter permease subunit [Paenibacillus arenilitoris]
MEVAFKRIRRNWQLYLLFLPPLAYVLVFNYYPMYGAQIAFKDFNAVQGIWGSDWVGLKHFEQFVQSYEFWRVMRNTLLLSLYSLLVGFPFPIILALGLNYASNRFFKRTVQMVTYAPHFISVVVIVGLMSQLLNPRLGVVNRILEVLGYEAINFMGKPELFKTLYVLSDVWQNVGFACIIYLAALSGIDPAQHEAAIMDGGSIPRRMWHIDLPGIMPVAVIIFILGMGGILSTGFEKVLLMQNPLNYQTSEVIDTYVYKVGLVSVMPNYSYSTAIGLFKSLIGLVLLIGVNRFAKKINQESLW